MNNRRSLTQIFLLSTLSLMLSNAYAGTSTTSPTYIFKRPVATLVVTQSPQNPGGESGNNTPSLFYSTDQLLFGLTQVGVPATKSFLITNIGTAPATLNPGVSLRSSAGVFGDLQTNCTSILLPGASCSVNLTFSPLDAQVYSSFVDVSSSNAGNKAINLTGEGVGQAIANLIAASGSSVNFGSVEIGSTKTESFIFSNSGNITDKGVYASLIGSNLAFTSNSCGTAGAAVNIAAGASCSMTVAYTPSSAGALSGGLSISSTATGQKTLSFTGSAIAGTLDLSTTAINYGPVTLGESSIKSFLIYNNGGATVNFTAAPSLRAGGSSAFAGLTSSCGSSLGAGSNCAVNVTFTPTSTTTFNGTVDVSTSNAGSKSVTLTGTGSGATLTLAAGAGSSANYGVVEVSKSKSNTFVLTNTGTTSATGVYAAVSGTGLSITSNTCGVGGSAISLGAGANCAVTVTYSPVAAGVMNGVLTLNSASYGPFTVNLSGTAETASIETSTNTVTFPDTEIGSTNTQIFSILNSSNIAVALNGVPQLQSGGSSAFSNLTTDCVSPLAAGAVCNVAVEFKPVALGTVTGTVAVNTLNAGNKSVSLSGKGTGQATVSLTPSGGATTDYGLVEVGSNKSTTFVYSNSGNVPATDVYASIAGVGYSITSNTCGVAGSPVSVGAGKGCSITVRFAPVAVGSGEGALSVSSAVPGTTETLNLSATIGQAVLDLSTPNLDFGTLQVGTRSPLSVLVINSGNVTANISQAPSIRVGSSNDFNSITTSCGTSLTPGATCAVSLYYQPTAVGVASGFVDIKSSNAAANKEVALSGVGAGQAISSLSFDSGSSSDFGVVQVGSSKTYTLTFKNAGNISATGVKAVLVGTGLSLTSNTCGVNGGEVTIPANGTCAVAVTYAPSAVSTLSGASLTIQSSAASGTNSTTFTGSGAGSAIPGVSAAAGSSTNFGNILVGATSSQTFTFGNTGNIAATGVYAAVTGTGLTIAANNCGTQAAPVSIAAGGSCNTTVNWNPASAGSLTGANITIGGQSLNLTGTASQITMNIQDGGGSAISAVSFGTVAATTTKIVRIRNSATSPAGLVVTNVSGLTSPYTITGITNPLGGATCTSVSNMSIPAGGSCDVNVQLSAATNGAYSGYNITISSNAQDSTPSGGSSVTLPVSGTVDTASSNVVALLSMESSPITDAKGHTVTTNGGTAQVSAGKFGNALNTSNGVYLTMSGTDFELGTGDFTVELWAKLNAANTYQRILAYDSDGVTTGASAWELAVKYNSSTDYTVYWGTQVNSPAAQFNVANLGTLSHIVIQRRGGVAEIYVNGVKGGTSKTYTNNLSAGKVLTIGSAQGGSQKFNGLIDDLRITKGIARYSANFTPPSAPY